MKFANSPTPSLLVFDVPGLIAAGGEDTVTYALPLVSRSGGLLLAFPAGVIDDDAFPSSAADEDQMVGPGRTFEDIELYEEDDAGSGVPQAMRCGITCSVTVCDFLDSVLAHLREYDPVTDSLLEVVPFDLGRPAAIPLHSELLEPALEWARNEVGGRVLFYSAREEPEVPAAAPKRAAAKRMTNAALAEKVSTLTAQMQLLMSQQAAFTNGPSPKTPGLPSRLASPAAELVAIGTGSKMPAVSQGLLTPGKQPAAPMALVGPPPRSEPVYHQPRCPQKSHTISWKKASNKRQPMPSPSSQRP